MSATTTKRPRRRSPAALPANVIPFASHARRKAKLEAQRAQVQGFAEQLEAMLGHCQAMRASAAKLDIKISLGEYVASTLRIAELGIHGALLDMGGHVAKLSTDGREAGR